jgi:hypothetical protein
LLKVVSLVADFYEVITDHSSFLFKSKFLRSAFLLGALISITSCLKNPIQESIVTSTSTRYLYVASGLCYSGAGNTTFSNITASNSVYRIDLNTGLKDIELADYNSSPSQFGDTPVGLASIDVNNLYVLIENTTTVGARRIEKIEKKVNASRTLFSNNTTAMSAVLRDLHGLPNGDLLISKSTAVEKITANNSRITKGANPFISAPAGTCATSTTLMSKVLTLNNGYIAFSHAAASQNRIGFVKAEGYASVGDCDPAQAAPNVNSYPVALAYDPETTTLLVAYSGNTTNTDINSIYAYTLTETSASVTISATNKIYDANSYGTDHNYLLYGISSLAYDSTEKKLYVATAINTSTTVANYSIEKLSFDASKLGTDNVNVLKKDTTLSFYAYGSDTKCISDMIISD